MVILFLVKYSYSEQQYLIFDSKYLENFNWITIKMKFSLCCYVEENVLFLQELHKLISCTKTILVWSSWCWMTQWHLVQRCEECVQRAMTQTSLRLDLLLRDKNLTGPVRPHLVKCLLSNPLSLARRESIKELYQDCRPAEDGSLQVRLGDCFLWDLVIKTYVLRPSH